MDRIRIEGGRPLAGEVEIGGAKNASLPLMAAALLADSPSLLEHIPHLQDVVTMTRMIEHLGADVTRTNGGIRIDPSGFADAEAPYELVRRMRASIYVLGPLLARFGHARVSLPGGCAIGTRPIDLHLHGLRALGAEIRIEHGYVHASAPSEGLRGADVVLEGPNGPSVGATCNVLMAAALARGHSVLRGTAREPHVADLAGYLSAMGASIRGAGTDVIEVDGVDRLSGTTYRVIPDQIETGTLMAGAAMTRGRVLLRGCRPDHVQVEIAKLREMGAYVEEDNDTLLVGADDRLRAISLRTAPYPGFPTDTQAQFMAALSLAVGESRITETVYPDRFIHVAELNRMGADITVELGSATVRGVERLSGATVMASDLRASAALILAGLAAEGTTECLRVYHLDRGYERLEEKFRVLGAKIERIGEKG
ncbi:UDP-N-acetylglucosamine 1-carboxyvinyltransferase [Candidatus Sumerlaeota bacterium]|nr:UDP-N-acetylglucosamine 1-carboxyvinyltransferase [Candidatus Sumerlaeota bacterium]